jgi:hypothetical protein
LAHTWSIGWADEVEEPTTPLYVPTFPNTMVDPVAPPDAEAGVDPLLVATWVPLPPGEVGAAVPPALAPADPVGTVVPVVPAALPA